MELSPHEYPTIIFFEIKNRERIDLRTVYEIAKRKWPGCEPEDIEIEFNNEGRQQFQLCISIKKTAFERLGLNGRDLIKGKELTSGIL